MLKLTLTWECHILQKKSLFNYGSDADGMEQILMRLEGPPWPSVGEESREAASPTVSQEEGLAEQPKLIVLKSRFDYSSDADDMERILTRLEGGRLSSRGRIWRSASLTVSRKERHFKPPELIELADSPATLPEMEAHTESTPLGGVFEVIPLIEIALSLCLEPLVELQ